MALRTRAIDDAIETAVRNGAHQLVLLGAGLDARAWRMESLRDCAVFEVDHPSTQAYKRTRIGALQPLARALFFVDVDFERHDLAERLAAWGHDATEPSIFVWEGVTMYLTHEAIEATLSAVARVAIAGSVLAMTYQSGRQFATLALLTRLVGEPFRTRFEPEEVRRLLSGHGFSVTSDESDAEWGDRYLSQRIDLRMERLACAVRGV
jgi:methyltransferase (TIGR00027 family)